MQNMSHNVSSGLCHVILNLDFPIGITRTNDFLKFGVSWVGTRVLLGIITAEVRTVEC